MRLSQLSFKSLLTCITLLLIFELIPASIFSQQTPSPSNQTTQNQSGQLMTPSSSVQEGMPAPRITTSIPKSTSPPPEKPVPFEAGPATRPNLITQAFLLSILSLLPFIIMILTSFLKIVVVLSLLRTALGVQQAPPNQVINGVALLLSLFIMYPTVLKMYDAAKPIIYESEVPNGILDPSTSTYVMGITKAASGPLRDFMKRNSAGKHQALFYRLVYRGLPDEYKASLKPDDFIVLVPAYITGQLKDAFEIGVLIYIPFFVIDLVTSNILLAMGMMMLSPVTISMPLKLFLLVMLDGWTVLIEGLVKTFL